MNDVYLITNRVNGKRYVGVTCRGYLERFKEHVNSAMSGSTTILHSAIRKYGVNNFDVMLLESDVSDDDVSQREKHYIQLYNTFYTSGIGYNMTEGGGGVAGYKHTSSTKQKISASLSGHVFPKGRNKKIQAAMTGREYKPEWRKALSAARSGRFNGPDNPFYGKHHSASTKSLVSKANTKHEVLQLDPVTKEVLRRFDNARQAGQWVVTQGITSASPSTCEGRISEVCRKGNLHSTAYSFSWKFEERSID